MKNFKKYLVFILLLTITLTTTSCYREKTNSADRSQTVSAFVEYIENECSYTFLGFGRGEWEPNAIIDYGRADEIAEKYNYSSEYLKYPRGFFYIDSKKMLKVDGYAIDHFNLIPDSHIINPKTYKTKFELHDKALIIMFYSPDINYIFSGKDFIKALDVEKNRNSFIYSQQDDVIHFILEPYMP